MHAFTRSKSEKAYNEVFDTLFGAMRANGLKPNVRLVLMDFEDKMQESFVNKMYEYFGLRNHVDYDVCIT